MLYLSFALYAEAAPFIKKLNLKAENRQTGFQVFSSENIKLIISGVGNLTSAINLTAFFAGETISDDDLFVNIGSAASGLYFDLAPDSEMPGYNSEISGSSPGTIQANTAFYKSRIPVFICNKLKELSTGKSFYPDLLYSHEFAEAICITSPVVVTDISKVSSVLFEEEIEAPVIFDMEACSCYQAAVRYFKTHRMVFLKYISDGGIDIGEEKHVNITPDKDVADEILNFILNISHEEKSREKKLADNASKATATLAPLLSCSVTMTHELERLLLYYECQGESSEDLIDTFIDEYRDQFPVHKKQGKLYFEELRNLILDSKLTSSNNLTESVCKPFSHIYVERQALEYPLTKDILAKFKNSTVIYIDHYKDIFNRRNQDFLAQKYCPSLILAVNKSERIYNGARTCQNFGHEHFYYTSQIKNCIYDCEYCYLQGMYPSGNINIFVNTEDYFADVDMLLEEHPVSLSISYDTDMTALDGITGLVEKWCEFASTRPNVTVEIRSKCSSTKVFEKLKPPSNVVFAYTLSPAYVAETFEHNASGYEARKKAFYTSLEAGCTTRLSIDPILPVENFEKIYSKTIDDIFSNPITRNISDVSIGGFRISKDYIKHMQNVRMNSLTTYPYSIRDGICTFDEATHKYMMNAIKSTLLKYISEDKLFISED